jgi:hypothetical protein
MRRCTVTRRFAAFALSGFVGSLLVLTDGTRALCQFGGSFLPESALIAILQSNPESSARLEAARLLGMRGSTSAISALASVAAFDPDRQVRRAAGDAIDLIRRRGSNSWVRPPAAGPNHRALLEGWYQLYLRRPADAAGLRDYLDRMRRGMGFIEVQAELLGSEEYFRLHGSRTPSWLTGLYMDVLGRTPSRAEIQNWTRALARRGSSRFTVAADFLRAAQVELSQRRP